jgi:hypothetical protein
MVVHAINPGVFYLATSSEDVFPAYVFFVWMLIATYFYFQTSKLVYFFFCSIFLAFSFMLHWTIGVPGFISLVLILIWKDFYHYKKIAWQLLFLFLIMSSIFYFASLFLSYPFLKIWYPGKAMGSMWVSSISFYKIGLLIVNSILYFFTAKSILALQYDLNLVLILIALIFFLIRKYIVFNNLNRKISQKLKNVLLFGILVLVFGSGMNLVEQASDPQFLIQTQFVLFLGFLSFSTIYLFRIAIVFFVFTSIVSIYAFNFDNIAKKPFKKINEHISVNKLLIVSDGFYSFIPMSKMVWHKNNNIAYYDFPSGFQYEALMSNSAFLKMSQDSIDHYVKNGHDLLLIGFLNQSPADLGKKFIGYDLTEKMKGMQGYFKTNFKIDTIEKRGNYPIFHLKPKQHE